MTDRVLSEPARRIAAEAFRLFAARGYARTSVADIHAAAGLAPGSGALYKHFRSKRDLLEKGLAAAYADRDDTTVAVGTNLPPEPRRALYEIGRAVLDQTRAERDVIRIACRDLEQFPELLAQVRDERIQPLYDLFAAWLTYQAGEGNLRLHDAGAVAAVAWGALNYYRISEVLVGEPPGRVEESRFLEAWVELVWRSLAPEAT